MADQDIMYDLYQKGELSSLIIGEWFLNWLTEEELAGRLDEPYAVAHLPVHDSSYLGQSTGQLMMAGISAQSRHPEEAYLFLEYLTGPEGARILAENRIVPAYYSDEIKEIYIRSIDNQTVGQIFDWRIDMEMPPYEYIGEINHVFHVYAGAYIRGELSREEMIAAFEEARRQIALGNGEQGV